MDTITLIANRQLAEALPSIMEAMDRIQERKLNMLRQVVGDVIFEANVMRQGRTLLIRRRIRKGKLQRNVRKSAVRGFTLRKGKITRIPVSKRIKMRITQKRASRKRKAHLQQTLRKRKLSMRKRKSMGIR